jgi:hypothetical protein
LAVFARPLLEAGIEPRLADRRVSSFVAGFASSAFAGIAQSIWSAVTGAIFIQGWVPMIEVIFGLASYGLAAGCAGWCLVQAWEEWHSGD